MNYTAAFPQQSPFVRIPHPIRRYEFNNDKCKIELQSPRKIKVCNNKIIVRMGNGCIYGFAFPHRGEEFLQREFNETRYIESYVYREFGIPPKDGNGMTHYVKEIEIDVHTSAKITMKYGRGHQFNNITTITIEMRSGGLTKSAQKK